MAKKIVKAVKRTVSKARAAKSKACGSCGGTGLQDANTVCPNCKGNGKV